MTRPSSLVSRARGDPAGGSRRHQPPDLPCGAKSRQRPLWRVTPQHVVRRLSRRRAPQPSSPPLRSVPTLLPRAGRWQTAHRCNVPCYPNLRYEASLAQNAAQLHSQLFSADEGAGQTEQRDSRSLPSTRQTDGHQHHDRQGNELIEKVSSTDRCFENPDSNGGSRLAVVDAPSNSHDGRCVLRVRGGKPRSCVPNSSLD